MEPNSKTEFYRQYYSNNITPSPKPQNPYHGYVKDIRYSSTILGFCIIIYIASTYFVSSAATAIAMGINIMLTGFGSMSLSTTTQYAINLISYVFCYTVPFLTYGFIISIPRRVALPLKKTNFSMTVSAVFIGLGASVIGSWVTQIIYSVMNLFGVYPISPDFTSPVEPAAAILNVISIVIVAPIFEELVFRGVIMQSFRRYGDKFALVISALLFALFHGNLVQAPNAFIMGLVIGFFVLKTGSLWTGISIHFANNLISTIFNEITVNIPVAAQNATYMILQVIYCILGVIGVSLIVTRSGFNLQNFLHINKNSKGQPYVPDSQKYLGFFTSPVMIVVMIIFLFFLVANVGLV